MWVNKKLLDMILTDNKEQQAQIVALSRQAAGTQTLLIETRSQKAKDDLSIDWLRHRVNALEKEKTILLGKSTGLNFPTPEIVPTRPGTISSDSLPQGFEALPNFEDVGDDAAKRLGITHDDEGVLAYTK